MPWAAWYGDESHDLLLPAGWHVDRLEPADSPELDEPALAAVLAEPDGAPPLAASARGARTACVVIDDLARPTRLERPLPLLLGQLEQAGLSPKDITVLVATGTHSVLTPEQLAWKVGPRVASIWRIACHDAQADLVGAGVQYGGRELRLARTFLEADVRVLMGTVLPHPFAGFSGGAKLVIPGVADLDATERTHKFVLMGLREASGVGTNAFRREIEELVARIGIALTVSAIPNLARQISALTAGDLVASHRRACELATRVYGTAIDDTYDCLVINAYPKDVDLIQTQNALGAVQRLARSPVREDGVLVLTTAATLGVGSHGLFAPGGRSYRPPARYRALGQRELWLYAPRLSEDEARQLHWAGYPFFDDRSALAEALLTRLGPTARAAVLPAASMQLILDRRTTTAARAPDPA